jgi:pimeloyl-ACP methyl ester carboxylesterase
METTKSADGTLIAYDRTGDGPPLVVAVGALCDRRTFRPPGALTERFTVTTFDRRGRGDSGDTQPYAAAREIEDLAAVVRAVGGGSAVYAYGHSSGATLVLRAAASGVPLVKLVAYEAPFMIPGTRELARDPVGHITSLVAAGRRDEAVRYWMTDVTQAPARILPMLEKFPAWKAMLALAHTLPYDLIINGDQGVPVDDLARINMPALVVGGVSSPPWFHRTVEATAAAIPGARLRMLQGCDHNVPHEVVSAVMSEFFLGSQRR